MASKDIPEIDPLEQTRMAIAREQAGEALDAAQADDAAGFQAAFAALAQTAKQVDLEAFMNSLHVPQDAGEWEDGLRRILARIPDGWGRWISCGKGWYPIIVRLDRRLAELFPDYTVEQVKEKYASLRYYCSYGYLIELPGDPEPTRPAELSYDFATRTWSDPEAYARFSAARESWRERFAAYLETAEGQALRAKEEAAIKEADALIKAAEEEAERTCERCGQPGELRMALARSPWLSCLCAGCGEGLATKAEWDAWWEAHEAEILAVERQRALDDFVRWHQDKRILVCCADESFVLRVPATYLRTPEDVEEHLADHFDDWDEIWVYGDACGERAVSLTAERYRAAAEAERERRLEKAGGQRGNIGPVWLKGTPAFCDMGGFPRQGGGISTLLTVGMRVSIPNRGTSYESSAAE